MLEAVDYILLLAVLTVSLGIGLYHSTTGGHQNTVAEFVLNNRQLNVLPTLLSFTASFFSAISVMYAPAEYYQWGSQMWLVGQISLIFNTFLIERLIVPVFFKLDLTSIYDYFEIRYQSKIVRCLSSMLGVLYAILYTSVTMLSVSVALETITDLPVLLGIVVTVGCCAVYTALGGMRAVIWTDVLQIVVMVMGLIVFSILGANEGGGLAKAFDTGRRMRRIYTRFDIDPRIRTTFWGALAASQTLSFYNFGFNQAAMQRFVALPCLGKARLMTLLMGPSVILAFSLCTLVGVFALSFFSDIQCDPLQSGILKSPNQLMPFFVKILFTNKSGGQGLFLAVICSGSLSTASSALSGCAANVWEDLIKTIIPGASERKGALANRLLVLFLAIVIIGITLLTAYIPGNMMQIHSTITGSVLGPLTGMFILALCSRSSEWRGAIIGCVSGMIMTAWLSLGSLYFPNRTHPLPPLSTRGCDSFLSNYSDINYGTLSMINSTGMEMHSPKGFQNLYTISFLWFSPIGMCTTFIVGHFSSKVLCNILSLPQPAPKRDHLIHFRDILSIDAWRKLCESDEIPVETETGTDEENRM